MSKIAELESALSEVFAEFTVEVADEAQTELTEADVREIRTVLGQLAGSRPSGN